MTRRAPSRRDLLWTLGLPLAPIAGAQRSQEVRFTDVAAQAGLARARNLSGDPVDKQFLIEEMGGGVALFDFDNDGWLDIFLVNGSSFEGAARRRQSTSYLFRNR